MCARYTLLSVRVQLSATGSGARAGHAVRSVGALSSTNNIMSPRPCNMSPARTCPIGPPPSVCHTRRSVNRRPTLRPTLPCRRDNSPPTAIDDNDTRSAARSGGRDRVVARTRIHYLILYRRCSRVSRHTKRGEKMALCRETNADGLHCCRIKSTGTKNIIYPTRFLHGLLYILYKITSIIRDLLLSLLGIWYSFHRWVRNAIVIFP